MLSQYGWLMVYGRIDDPSAEENGCDVRIRKDDVIGGQRLCPGDVVTFYLFKDATGLGAEECRVEQRAVPLFNPNAPEFVPKKSMPAPCPWAEVMSIMHKVLNDMSFDEDDESYLVPEGMPKAFLLDQSSFNEDDKCCMVPKAPPMVFDGMSSDEGDDSYIGVFDDGGSWKEKDAPPSDGSTDDGSTDVSEEEETLSGRSYDSEEEEAIEKASPKVKPLPPWKLWKLDCTTTSDGSTDGGSNVDSEEETSSGKAYDSEEEEEAVEKVSHQVKIPLPANFRPPPGLSLPPWRSKSF